MTKPSFPPCASPMKMASDADANRQYQKDFRDYRSTELGRQVLGSCQGLDPQIVAALSLTLEATLHEVLRHFAPRPPNTTELKEAIRLVLLCVIPRVKRGRPLSSQVSLAAELRTQTPPRPWRTVYNEVVPGFWSLSRDEQTVTAIRLRQAVNRRIKANKEKSLEGLSA